MEKYIDSWIISQGYHKYQPRVTWINDLVVAQPNKGQEKAACKLLEREQKVIQQQILSQKTKFIKKPIATALLDHSTIPHLFEKGLFLLIRVNLKRAHCYCQFTCTLNQQDPLKTQKFDKKVLRADVAGIQQGKFFFCLEENFAQSKLLTLIGMTDQSVEYQRFFVNALIQNYPTKSTVLNRTIEVSANILVYEDSLFMRVFSTQFDYRAEPVRREDGNFFIEYNGKRYLGQMVVGATVETVTFKHETLGKTLSVFEYFVKHKKQQIDKDDLVIRTISKNEQVLPRSCCKFVTGIIDQRVRVAQLFKNLPVFLGKKQQYLKMNIEKHVEIEIEHCTIQQQQNDSVKWLLHQAGTAMTDTGKTFQQIFQFADLQNLCNLLNQTPHNVSVLVIPKNKFNKQDYLALKRSYSNIPFQILTYGCYQNKMAYSNSLKQLNAKSSPLKLYGSIAHGIIIAVDVCHNNLSVVVYHQSQGITIRLSRLQEMKTSGELYREVLTKEEIITIFQESLDNFIKQYGSNPDIIVYLRDGYNIKSFLKNEQAHAESFCHQKRIHYQSIMQIKRTKMTSIKGNQHSQSFLQNNIMWMLDFSKYQLFVGSCAKRGSNISIPLTLFALKSQHSAYNSDQVISLIREGIGLHYVFKDFKQLCQIENADMNAYMFDQFKINSGPIQQFAQKYKCNFSDDAFKTWTRLQFL